jgi:hypothetical protein
MVIDHIDMHPVTAVGRLTRNAHLFKIDIKVRPRRRFLL